MKRSKSIFLSLLVFLCFMFTTCENGIVEKWWQEHEPDFPFLIEIRPEFIIEKIVEIEIIYEQIFTELPPEIIFVEVVKEITVEKIVEIINEVIVYVPVEVPLTIENIIEFIKTQEKDVIKEILKEIIKEIPSDVIQEIIISQPPHRILQTIQVIDVEFILFAGDSLQYNGQANAGYNSPPLNLPPGGTTNLTAEEKLTNNNTIRNIGNAMKSDPDLLLILHGHANPVLDSSEEEEDLEIISMARAEQVKNQFLNYYNNENYSFTSLTVIPSIPAAYSERIQTSGYGGENTIAATTYQGLNRRVEVILLKIETIEE